MNHPALISLSANPLPLSVGKKALNLRRLADKRFRIPATWVIPWEIYLRYLDNDHHLIDELRNDMLRVLDPEKEYAVRSSADIEDSVGSSFAGQFKSVLHAQGFDPIFQAVWSIWATAQSIQVDQYRQKSSNQHDQLRMAVIIQEMIFPLVSGISFSLNPVTGADELIIEAVKGEGLSLIQEGITPFRWVYRGSRCIEKPDETILPQEVIDHIARETKHISTAFSENVDTEWVYDGKHVTWVQARAITGIKPVSVYSNRIAREMIPGIVKPLIWSFNIPLVNSVWINLLEEVMGKSGIKPEDLAKSFYYRLYFNMDVFARIFDMVGLPPDGLETMMGIVPRGKNNTGFKPSRKMVRLLPRLLVFVIDKWNFSKKIKRELPSLQTGIASFDLQAVSTLDAKQLMVEIDRLYPLVKRLAYFNVVVPLLLAMYNRMNEKQLQKLGFNPGQVKQLDQAEIQEYAPNTHLQHLHQEFRQFSEELQKILPTLSYVQFLVLDGIDVFKQHFSTFIRKFGHLSDSGNDFSSIPWREKPELVLKLIYDFPDEFGESRIFDDVSHLPLAGMRRWMFTITQNRNDEYRLWREKISSLYTYGYGLFRPHFLALADLLVQRGSMQEREDIFFLELNEIRSAVQDPVSQNPMLGQKINHRKAEITSVADYDLPSLVYGDVPPPVAAKTSRCLKGTPTSPGYYRGRSCVVKGIEDFHKMLDGDILVVPFTDVGWLPLFARAGAVVAESGGILSHSSTIAREYHIPAVVSVQGAARMADGVLVTVDGFRGEVIIETSSQE